MTIEGLPEAEHFEMDRRVALANEFYDATGAEVAPFVSDDATWYDFDYVSDSEVVSMIESHYGVRIDSDALTKPFWSLLSFLDSNRTQTP